MSKRIRLVNRKLPDYTIGEEIMNMVTHITGGGLSIIMLLLCLTKTIPTNNTTSILGCIIYGFSLICVYTMSSIYHGLHKGTGKKVLQVLDHCMIYLLIAGTYTPIMLTGFMPIYPKISKWLLIFEWVLAILAITLNAIDLQRYKIFSMICYIGLGWAIAPFLKEAYIALSPTGFWYLFSGGIAYTIGAVLFGIGAKKRWIHSVFHIFVIIGSILQFLCIYLFIL